MPPPCQPKIASSSCTVAPLSAARVAPALRTPWADFPVTPAAFLTSQLQMLGRIYIGSQLLGGI
jgi:hypothetical protein